MGGFGLPAFDFKRWALFCRPACACADDVSALLAQRLDDLIPLISSWAILVCSNKIHRCRCVCFSDPGSGLFGLVYLSRSMVADAILRPNQFKLP